MQRGGIAQADDTSHTLACLLHSNGGGGGGGGERMLRGAQARAAPSDSLDLFNRELLA